MSPKKETFVQNLREFGAVVALLGLVLLLAGAAGDVQAELSTSNAEDLSVLWTFPLSGGVTARPILADGLLYATSWDGSLYALDPETGAVVWSFDTGSGAVLGSQSTVFAASDGSVLFGDSFARIWSLDAATGAVNWTTTLGSPGLENIWSGVNVANGRVLVSVASLLDNPCTNGRLVALDLTTGSTLWTLPTVPTRVCRNDTATTCTLDTDCAALGPVPLGGPPTGADPNDLCMVGLGAGVTATVSFDPNGDFAYMNTVGCFTYPSIGDSDTIFKLDAATGTPVWKTRVNPPEQVGACDVDQSIDCGTAADCPSGTCTKKANYHDYGFLNGPTPVEIDDGGGGTKTILVSGSKDGTLYALNEPNGDIEWTNAVLPIPITPDFAGFGLFNGPVSIADGRVHAALYEFSPATVPAPDHLQAFDVVTGATLWTDDIGRAWAGTSVANGVVLVATGALGPVAAELYAYDAATGERLATLSLPTAGTAQATVDDDTVYAGYGTFGPGGVRAFRVPNDKDQQKCVNELNKGLGKVAKAQGKNICRCIKDAAKEKLVGLIEDCLTTDSKGKVAKAKAKTLAGAAKKCGVLPNIGPTDPNAVNNVAVAKEIDLFHDVFGANLDGVIELESLDKPTSKCQQAVAKAVKKCQDTKLKVFNACKKSGLKGKASPPSANLPFTGRVDLELCMGDDPKGKILAKCDPVVGRIRSTIVSKCAAPVNTATAFPGCGTGDPAALAACLDDRVECRLCLALNLADNLERDCDDFDDGLANASCP